MAESTPEPVSSNAPMPVEQKSKLTIGDSIGVIALLIGVFLVIVVPPLPFKSILHIGVCAGVFVFSRHSHWTHRWTKSKQRLSASLLTALLCLVAIPQFISQWKDEHPKKAEAPPQTSSQPKKIPIEAPQIESPTVKPIPNAKPLKAPEIVQSSPMHPSSPSENCPNGICIGGDNSGSAVVNNYGTLPDVPESSMIPLVTICSSESLATGNNKYFPGDSYLTTITLRTDTPITRPSYGFLFNGPVGNGDISITGVSTTPYANNVKLLNYEDRSYALKLISMDFPNGSDRWIPGVVLTSMVPSKEKVKLEKIFSYFGKEQKPLGEHRKFTCDIPLDPN